jgi:hypothetical protein
MTNGTDTGCLGKTVLRAIFPVTSHFHLASAGLTALRDPLRSINLARWARLVWICTVGAFAWSRGIGWSAEFSPLGFYAR